MSFKRRDFIKGLGALGIGSVIAPSIACSNEKKDILVKEEIDPTVKKYCGPFGEGEEITMAGYDYNRVVALTDGRVKVKGCKISYEVTGIGPLNIHAFYGKQTRDVTEIGLIPYILAFANGGFRDYLLLPIPVLRIFRHRSIFVRTDSGINEPKDLIGKRVATVGYSSSGLTHVRGILQDEYGVRPDQITWISTKKDSAANLTGGVSDWEKVKPEGVEILDAPEGEDESTLLLSGQVDAIFHPAEPMAFQQRNPKIRRLFEDYKSVESEFYKRTGIFPIMHTVAIKKTTVEKNPWLVKAVFDAYSEAKKLDMEYINKLAWAYDSLPWYGQEFESSKDIMGDNYYPYGFDRSKDAYQKAADFLYDQKLLKKKMNIEEMFVSSSLGLKENN